jgi:hypothetical protein
MDKEIQEPARIDPPITVEPAEPLTPAADTRPARGSDCPHRLRWSDLTWVARYSIARRTVFALATVAVAIGALLEGIAGLRDGLASGDVFAAGLSLWLIPTAIVLTVGPAEYLRTLRRPHQPRQGAFALYNWAFAVLAIAVFAGLPGREWLAFALIPPYTVMRELGRFRRTLSDRTSCANYPGLPMILRYMRKDAPAYPATDEERTWLLGPRLVEGDFDSWECPHWAPLSKLRRRVVAESVVLLNAVYLYALGAIATTAAAVLNLERFSLPEMNEPVIWYVAAAGLALLNLGAYQALMGGTHMHRLDLSRYLSALATLALTAALAAWTAAVLDRHYLWATVPLALFLMYGIVRDIALYTPTWQCKSRPELHPRVQAGLKA